MKVSKDTLSILKAFSTINPVMYLGDSKAVKVIAPDKSAIIGVYQTPESLDHDCVFWDWPTLLATIDSMGGADADLDFQESFVKISSPDKSSLKYFYTNPIVVAASNTKPKAFADYCKEMETDFTFELSSEVLSKVMKLARVMNLTKIVIESEDNKGSIHLVDDGNKVNHTFEQEIETSGSGKISLWISTLNIIPGSYTVTVKNNLFAKFVNKDIPLFYIIGAKKE